jgi:hypothetical protein
MKALAIALVGLWVGTTMQASAQDPANMRQDQDPQRPERSAPDMTPLTGAQ